MIQVEYYNGIFFNFMLFVTVVVFLMSLAKPLDDATNIKGKRTLGMGLLWVLLLFVGTRPISGYFIDMSVYARMFNSYAQGMPIEQGKDVYFDMFMQFCSGFMSAEMFFFLCAGLFLFPIYFACRKLFDQYWFYGFLMVATTLIFWSCATNGIRNGIALSFCLLAISSHQTRWKMVLYFLLAILIHKSMMLVTASFVVSSYFRNTKWLLYGWLGAIAVSLAAGSFFENLVMAYGLGEDDRFAVYFGEEEDEAISSLIKTGFRWDFLFYSALAILSGWYFIVKKGFTDRFYVTLFGTYVIANAFWVLVIRANFSNRFAALSWFFMGVVMVYPMLKMRFFRNQHAIVTGMALFFYAFTYVLLFVLNNSSR